MRTAILQIEIARQSPPVRRCEPRVATALVVAAGSAAMLLPTLVALTYGWDFRLAAILGAWLAAACFVFGRRTVAAEDDESRLTMEYAAAAGATVFLTYASDWLDWRPLGIDDALAGLTLGLVLVLAGYARRALRAAAIAPGEVCFALTVLVVAPAGLAYAAPFFGFPAVEHIHDNLTARIAGLATSLVLAWAGMAFASRRGLHGTVSWLSVLFGLVVFALLDESDVPFDRAAVIAVFAGALPALGAVVAGCASTWRREGRLDGLLAALFGASVVSAAVGAWLIAGCTAASVMGMWWWFYRRRGVPLVTPGSARRIDWKQSAVAAVLTLSFCALYLTQGFLLSASAFNPTGPMLLAAIGNTGLYRVSDFTFSEALLADQYLWRDAPASSKHIAAASPARLVRLMRTGRDRWSGADRVAASRAREDRNPKGVGLEFGPESADGLTVSYVYAGSPAAAAGIRRGDVVRAINGIPADAFRAGAVPTVPRRVESTRLEFAASSHAHGEVTIAWDEYLRPAVILDKVVVAGGRRVGYLVLQDFDESATLEFAQAAARLRKQGIDDLVLDLRMNPGGSVHVARAIASAIGGRRLDGATFLRIVHNERYRDSDHDVRFRSSAQADLSLPRLFVITSEESCSASEALVNGLAPYMTVVTVGTATCGKPVGMTVVEYGDWTYWVITFRVLNSRGEGDYFNGLRPTCLAEDDFAHELGDPAEASLRAALHYVRYGRCPDRPG
jgi:C-terminal processing protease CtpA/Prc